MRSGRGKSAPSVYSGCGIFPERPGSRRCGRESRGSRHLLLRIALAIGLRASVLGFSLGRTALSPGLCRLASGFALGCRFGGVCWVGGRKPVAAASDDHLPVVVVNEVVAVPAHQHEVVEASFAAALAGCDVVGFAFAGRFPAADARLVAGDQRASLCCGRCPAGDGLIQRCEVVAEDLDPDIGVARQPPQGAGRDRADATDLGDAPGLAGECCEVSAHDDLCCLGDGRGNRPGY